MSHHTQLRIIYENSHFFTDFNNWLMGSSLRDFDSEIYKEKASHVGDIFLFYFIYFKDAMATSDCIIKSFCVLDSTSEMSLFSCDISSL